MHCKLHVRLGLVDLVVGAAFEFPLTQAEMAECLGLSNVYVDWTLMQLRSSGLIELRANRLAILDLDRLRTIA